MSGRVPRCPCSPAQAVREGGIDVDDCRDLSPIRWRLSALGLDNAGQLSSRGSLTVDYCAFEKHGGAIPVGLYDWGMDLDDEDTGIPETR